MKQVLVVGSTCVDVLLSVNHVPVSGEDISVSTQQLRIGGCAYNVSDMIRHFGVPYTLCSPVGTGIYGLFVESKLTEKKIPVFARIPNKENGCCYCIVDRTGERTFLSFHGAEYLFKKEWFQTIDRDSYDTLFMCGFELEEETGSELVSFVESESESFKKQKKHLDVYFAPGPRITSIDPVLIDRLLKAGCIIHFNEEESIRFTGEKTVLQAARAINRISHNSVIITLGANGAFCLDSSTNTQTTVPAKSANVVDTIGAGDSHLGTIIACMKKGFTLAESVRRANHAAAAVVGVSGATLADGQFSAISF
jgi:sugar/nucleoside kinase (ribokinase family)